MADASRELADLAKRLKAAGESGVRREMVRSLKAAAQPMVPKLREAALADLPRRGGLNERVANHPIKVSVRTSGRRMGVSIRAQWTATNKATWRHPVFGNREKWVTQTFSRAGGWFDKTAQANTPAAKARVTYVLREVAGRVNRSGF